MNISVPVFQETITFLDYLQGLSDRFNVPLRFSRFVEVGRGKNLSDKMLDKEGYKKLFDFCRKNNHMLQDPFFYMYGRGNRIGCTCGVNIFYIITDGTVWPCWRMQISLGNIKDQPLSEIMMNPIIKDYQNREKLKGKCGACEYKYVCGGCRAVPYVLYGDYHGEDPQCPIKD
jgi:radical SAM protein with 4Fe4S-binding SPASM domain